MILPELRFVELIVQFGFPDELHQKDAGIICDQQMRSPVKLLRHLVILSARHTRTESVAELCHRCLLHISIYA